jgi:UDP-3-O-[3-hydroxymyristoyl] N-acetylglucosamine deacetylase
VIAVDEVSMTKVRNQRTLLKPVGFSGIGIHTGKQVAIRFVPAKEGTGVVFQRVDLPNKPIIPATIEYVRDTSRSTTIGIGNVLIHTVEHVLAAIKAYEIDNLCIEVSDIEPPVGNGSSDVFVKMIEESGIKEQNLITPIARLKNPLFFSQGDIHIVGLPHDSFKISYTLQYPESEVLRGQFHSIDVNGENFKNEVASCRTFARYEEIEELMNRGLIKGGSLANAVIIKDNAVLSKDGLFFPDEMARHKVLDLIGDISLVGISFHAHIISIRSGHASNFEFAKLLYNHITMEKK